MSQVRASMTDVLRLAAAASCDVRSARKAIEQGPGAFSRELIRDRIAKAMGELGITPLKEADNGAQGL